MQTPALRIAEDINKYNIINLVIYLWLILMDSQEEVATAAIVDPITEQEQKCLDVLQEEFPEAKERTLLRFVRARQADTAAARDMFRNYRKWRSQYPDQIDLSGAENELRYGIWHFHGLSKEGYPCIIIKAARFFPGACTRENLIKMAIYAMEKIFDTHPDEQVVVLVDYSGFGYANVSYDTIQWLIQIYSDYYPEVSIVTDRMSIFLHVLVILTFV